MTQQHFSTAYGQGGREANHPVSQHYYTELILFPSQDFLNSLGPLFIVYNTQPSFREFMLRVLREGADKSLARPTFQCSRTESTVSLEGGVCSCAELQVFSCYRGWKEACQVTRAISTTSRRELSSRFFFFLQDKTPKEIHAILTETLGEHAPSYATVKTGWPSLNVVIFPRVMRFVLDDPKQLPARRLLI